MSLLTSWLNSPPPDAAVEIAAARVSAASMGTRGGSSTVQSYAVETLPPGAVVPSINSHNVIDRAAVTAALRTVLGRLGNRVARVALVLPDAAAKVSLIHFDHVPAKRDDLDQLVRWQVRKSAPFAIDDACITYTPCARSTDGGGEFLVVLAKRSVIEEYERVCSDAGAYAGLIDLTSLSVLNLILASTSAPAGDWLTVYMRPEDTSIAIIRGGHVIFFRNRPEGGDDTLTDLVHQTAMYYQDRLSGRGFARVMLGGSGRAPDALDLTRRSLEERLGTRVEPIDPTSVAALSDRISVTPDLVDVLTPLTGMLLRTQREGVSA
jgi:Tfp pilus assembly PilM family ATPase